MQIFKNIRNMNVPECMVHNLGGDKIQMDKHKTVGSRQLKQASIGNVISLC